MSFVQWIVRDLLGIKPETILVDYGIVCDGAILDGDLSLSLRQPESECPLLQFELLYRPASVISRDVPAARENMERLEKAFQDASATVQQLNLWHDRPDRVWARLRSIGDFGKVIRDYGVICEIPTGFLKGYLVHAALRQREGQNPTFMLVWSTRATMATGKRSAICEIHAAPHILEELQATMHDAAARV